MTTVFNKGDKVTYITSWDNKGTVVYRDAIVHSCDKKQMILIDPETLEEMGRLFKPAVGFDLRNTREGTYPRMTEAEAITECLRLGALIVQEQTHRFNSCITANEANTPYINAIKRELSELHEPRAMSYKVARANVRNLALGN
jgi:hypothetical protein